MNVEVVNAEKYSLLQLKAWCAAVGVNASGAKASLAARLSELSAEARGSCPGVNDKVAERSGVDYGNGNANVQQQRSKDTDGDNGENNGESNGESSDNGADYNEGARGGVNDDDGATYVQDVIACTRNGTFGVRLPRGNGSDDGASNGPTSDRNNGELQAERLKLELLQKEIELLKLQKALVEKNDTKLSNEVSFETLKEIIPVYDGGDGFNVWKNQVAHYKNVFKVSDAMLGVAVHTKLKGAALCWYNAKSVFPESVDELLQEMKTVFASGESKLERRRKFEKRTWAPEESFANYFNEKCILAGDLQLSDEELADYLIEGIPDRQLRNQARLQNFTSANEVVRAFRSITLPERQIKKPRAEERMRCYNCNCTGHYAKECRKPRREAGSCYACGEQGHYAADCTKYKKPKNTFVSYFKLSILAQFNTYMFIECLVDSGSPISLVEDVVVPAGAKLEEVKETYHGVNRSVLKVFGKVKCVIKVLNKDILVELLVVPSGCIGYSVVLGRDFIMASNARLKIGNAEFLGGTEQAEKENGESKVEREVEKVYEVQVNDMLNTTCEDTYEQVDNVKDMSKEKTNDKDNVNEFLMEIMAIDTCEDGSLELKLGEQLSYDDKIFQDMFRK